MAALEVEVRLPLHRPWLAPAVATAILLPPPAMCLSSLRVRRLRGGVAAAFDIAVDRYHFAALLDMADAGSACGPMGHA
jgi:hypothetical protein